MNEKYNKIIILGCGTVGTTVAFSLLMNCICDEIVFLTTHTQHAEGEILDLQGGMSYLGNSTIIRLGTYEDCKNADIILFIAGSPPRDGETRLDNWRKTKQICNDVIPPIIQAGFNGIFLIVSNPVDLVTYYILHLTNFPKNKVIGTGTGVDTSRLKNHLANIYHTIPQNIQAYCLGEHGDTMCIPWSQVLISNNLPIHSELTNSEKDAILEQVKQEGWSICDKKGKTCYGIALTCVTIIKAILTDSNSEEVVTTLLEGEYGINNACTGVPTIINSSGVATITILDLLPNELRELQNSPLNNMDLMCDSII